MVVVIDRVERMGDIGEPVYVAYGQSLPTTLTSCHMRRRSLYSSGVKKNLSEALPTGCYITEGVYAYLSKYEIEPVRSKILGLIKESYSRLKSKAGGWAGECWYELAESAVIGPLPALDPCAGVICKPECVGTDRYATVCKDGKCVRGGLMESNSAECGYVKPECTPGDKKPGYVCSGGRWIPYTPGAGRLYVKCVLPILDQLPGIPYESWMWIPPGFAIVEVS